MTLNISDEQQEQAARLTLELWRKKIVTKRLNPTVALLMAEDVISFILSPMCPACREAHWRMLEAHFQDIRSRAEELYKNAYPDKPPICDRPHLH